MKLAIIRYNYRSVEYVRGLCKRQIIGYPLEVPMVFPSSADPIVANKSAFPVISKLRVVMSQWRGQLLPA